MGPDSYRRSTLAIVGACLALVGSALPWAGLGGWLGPSGLHGDGILTAVAGLIALGVAMVAPLGPWRRTLCVLLGVAICVVVTVDIANVQGVLADIRAGGGELGVAVSGAIGIGIGLYVTAAGGAFVLFGGLIGE